MTGNRELYKKIWVVSLPIIFQNVIDAAVSSADVLMLNYVVRNLGCVMCYGIGSASGIVVGQILGEGDMENGIRAGHLCLRLAVVTGILGGIVVLREDIDNIPPEQGSNI